MTDQQIIQAAREAGLCFPSCWSLIAPWDPTRDVSDEWGGYEHGQMDKLRRFAELIKASQSDQLVVQHHTH
jgi:hypothetical protein